MSMSFLDKVGKVFSDATNTVVEKTKSSTDNIRLNGQINEEERKINEAYMQIGKKYLELHQLDAEPEFQEMLSAMAESRRKIGEYQAQIRKNKHVILCANCNEEIPETVLYCTSCGAENPVGKRLAKEREEREAAERAAAERAAANAVPPAASAMVCKVCGKPYVLGDKFCTHCGTPLPSAPVPVEPVIPTPAPASSSVEPVTPTPVPVSSSAESVIPTPVEQRPEQPKNAVRICPVCGSVMAEQNRFCTKCGSPMGDIPQGASEQVEPVIPTPPETVWEENPPIKKRECPSCGSPVPPENRFCTKCGQKMPDENENEPKA